MNLAQLVDRTNEIHRALDKATAEVAPERREALLRDAVIFACRTYTEVVRDEDLPRDVQRLREASDSIQDARRILDEQYRDLVRAEIALLSRMGLDAGLISELEQILKSAQGDALRELESDFSSASMFGELRNAICDEQDGLLIEATGGRRRKKIRGGLIGLCGVLVCGGNGALALVTGGVALASGAVGGALVGLGGKEILDRD